MVSIQGSVKPYTNFRDVNVWEKERKIKRTYNRTPTEKALSVQKICFENFKDNLFTKG